MSSLTISGLSHGFAGRPVLDRVSLSLHRGAVGCLIGPSGCGKSTLLSMIGGLSHPESGDIRHDFRHPVFVFQEPCLLPWRDARDNIGFGLKSGRLGRRQRRARADHLLDVVGLTDEDGDKFPHELSGGMRQRVAVARALAVEPDLLLLDEPFSALDLGLRRQMQALVRHLIAQRRLTAMLVTHDLDEAVRLADHIFVLTPAPARLAAHHVVSRPADERDDSFVRAEIDRLLAHPATAQALSIDER